MKREAWSHWKFAALGKSLGLRRWQVAGLLETLWWWTAEHRDDGRLTGVHAGALAAVMEWDGDADALVGAFVESGWLDRTDDGVLSVHGWEDHCPSYIHARRRQRVTRQRAPVTPSHVESRPVTIGHAPSRDVTPRHALKGPRLGKARLGKTESASHSPAHAREASPPSPLDPAAAIVAELESIGPTSWTRPYRQQATKVVRALLGDGILAPAIIAAWRAYVGDDFWRTKGSPPEKFREQFPRYATSARPPAAARPACECGAAAVRHDPSTGAPRIGGMTCTGYRPAGASA